MTSTNSNKLSRLLYTEARVPAEWPSAEQLAERMVADLLIAPDLQIPRVTVRVEGQWVATVEGEF